MVSSLSSVLLSVPLAIAEAIAAHPKEASDIAAYAWLLPVLPLAGFTLLIFGSPGIGVGDPGQDSGA